MIVFFAPYILTDALSLCSFLTPNVIIVSIGSLITMTVIATLVARDLVPIDVHSPPLISMHDVCAVYNFVGMQWKLLPPSKGFQDQQACALQLAYYATFHMGPPQVSFSFSEDEPFCVLMFGILVLAYSFQVNCWGSTIWDFNVTTFGACT